MIEITLNVEDYCNDCPFFSTETTHVRNAVSANLVIISCKHKCLCKRLIEHLDSRTKREDR